jgi:hypothetical protein
VGYEEPPFKDVSLPGMAPTKELHGFEELGDKPDPQTTKQDEESLQDNIGFQAVLLHSMGKQDSTFDAFVKLTGGNPSEPFNIDSDEDASKEEI